MKTYKINRKVIPKKIIFSGKVWKITQIEEKYIINNFFVKTNDENKIIEINLNDPHPNCDPKTNIFCLPDNLLYIYFDKNSLNLIENMIMIYHLDSCYFTPWEYIKWETYANNDLDKSQNNNLLYRFIKLF